MDIYSVPSSHGHWGCKQWLNPCPYVSYYVVVETNSKQIKEGGDGFTGGGGKQQ